MPRGSQASDWEGQPGRGQRPAPSVAAVVAATLLLAGLAVLAAPSVAAAQTPASPVIHHNSRAFRIPLDINPTDRAYLQEIRLYVSSDYGKTWGLAAKGGAEQLSFTYRADRDTEYWFAVRTVNTRGVLNPPENATVEPSLKVRVDTEPPLVTLDTVGRTADRVKVRWEVSDETLALETLTLQYRAEGAPEYRQVPLTKPVRIGAEEWECGTAMPIEVRATVSDKAGNQASREIRIDAGTARERRRIDAASSPGLAPPVRPFTPEELAASNPLEGGDLADTDPGGFAPMGAIPGADPDQFFGPADGFNPGSASPATASVPRRNTGTYDEPAPGGRMTGVRPGNIRQADPEPEAEPLLVNNPRFNLEYAVDGASQNGPALVELWVTRDGGRSWSAQPEDVDRKSPYPVDLGSEGTFGFWLVVQSASGLGDRPPQPGDRPMQWVVVDSTPPQVEMFPPQVGYGPQLGKVLLTWRAADPHLARHPVVLAYRDADQPGSPWIPFTDLIDNTGRYVWTVPPDAPARLHLRIDVVDALGNRAVAETTSSGQPVIVDRSRPRGRILGLVPGADGAVSATPRR